MRLKSRAKAATPPQVTNGVRIIVDGKPVEPYELPDRPIANEEEMRRMRTDAQRRRESERSMFPRALDALVEGIRKRKGRGFAVTIFRRVTFEFHRVPTNSGEKFRLELYRRLRWDFTIELWRSR